MLSISQLCDTGYKIMFDHSCCLILENDKVIFIGIRKGYKSKIDASLRIDNCLIANISDCFIWYRRIG